MSHISSEQQNYLDHIFGQIGYALFINPKDQEMKRYRQILLEYKQAHLL